MVCRRLACAAACLQTLDGGDALTGGTGLWHDTGMKASHKGQAKAAVTAPATELRARKRVQSRFTLRYRPREEVEIVEQTVETLDISANGLAFITATRLPVGAHLDILIDLPTTAGAVKTDARVVRVQELEENKRYLVALAFLSMTPTGEQAIEAYVHTVDLDDILRAAVERKASDVHLVANRPPMFRIDGNLVPFDTAPLAPAFLERMILSILSERQRKQFENDLELDFSYVLQEGVRFRANTDVNMGHIEAALRVIPSHIRTTQELGLPPIIDQIATLRKGLVIVTGPAGSGKSTTLATIIDLINRQRSSMIISIEDPIEYVHTAQQSVVKQREVGYDTRSFASALKHVLRQDPNVILVGEIRDLDSIAMSITAAETGHLVLTSLHTPNTVECIHRIVDVYPANQQNQIRSQLAECLQAVVGQVLLPRKDTGGMIVATEVLVCTQPIRNLIRQGQTEQINSYIQSGIQFGMHTLDSSLVRLVSAGVVEFTVAQAYARNPQKFAV